MTAALELRNLTKRYGDAVALDGLGFGVEPGQVFGFVGSNGAGKTTAMRIILGVLAADSGEVRWRGEPVDADARRRFGYMPEERGLHPKMRVGDQLAYMGALHGLSDAAAKTAAANWMQRLGIDERAGDPVEALSLGNQQRVQLAAALVHDPELLVLDEPFSGLDPVGVDVLSGVLETVACERQVPIVFSSHQIELVERVCDAVAIIDGGRLVAAGEVDELRDMRAGNRWRVEVEGASSDWAAAVHGVEPAGPGIFELALGTDPQLLLDAARAGGRVIRFGPDVPSLAELFRDVVGRDGASGDVR